jgi:hypothetical protein
MKIVVVMTAPEVTGSTKETTSCPFMIHKSETPLFPTTFPTRSPVSTNVRGSLRFGNWHLHEPAWLVAAEKIKATAASR